MRRNYLQADDAPGDFSQYAEQWVEKQCEEKGINEFDQYGRLLNSISKQAVPYALKHGLSAQGFRQELEEADNLEPIPLI